MTRNVLLLGIRMDLLEDIQAEVHMPGTTLLAGTDMDSMKAAFAQASVDHVIMGAGFDSEARLQMVREIFRLSDATTVHMKDRATGREGFPSFVEAVLKGLGA